ncbi:carboxymuconolactone decarboxylase family protein [Alkalihalobacillus sp. LMS39]|uniref:carboxymuconolactone decarboxylase family protein n=1 Tax=Alkalihalobacillus sp. LMS39 TaxID=2924032 RepID=UPI001FB21E7C|nr:carboxymuconolactone decarboxylase family protein [Alkalihalobacillus sp. LMS39]UOE95821.1 carboxymuconolactone decarboxylase family protein [Alkalihalobacillus sp. LMS39]
MTRIKESIYGKTPFERLLGHNVDIMKSWSRLGEVLEKGGYLSCDLKEQVRRTLAQSNGCAYCKAKGKPAPATFDEKTAVAVGFAEVFLKQKGAIQDSIFTLLKESFRDEEISELCAFIAFSTASQYFGAIMNLQAGGLNNENK